MAASGCRTHVRWEVAHTCRFVCFSVTARHSHVDSLRASAERRLPGTCSLQDTLVCTDTINWALRRNACKQQLVAQRLCRASTGVCLFFPSVRVTLACMRLSMPPPIKQVTKALHLAVRSKQSKKATELTTWEPNCRQAHGGAPNTCAAFL